MRKTELSDHALCKAVDEMAKGLIDADMGGGVVKKRVALPGRGKRGSVRTLVATNKGNRWFFVFGFEKNERANIGVKEKEALQRLAEDLLRLSIRGLAALIEEEKLTRTIHKYCRALACSFVRTESLVGRPYAWLRSPSLESVANKGPAQSSRRFMNSLG